VILAGVRLAFVQVIATTAIGAIVTNGGGLGRFIVDGFATGRAGWPAVVAGALLLGALTLLAEGAMHLVQRRLVPVGVRGGTGIDRVADRAAQQVEDPTTDVFAPNDRTDRGRGMGPRPGVD
jgi:hypothetical protein